MKQRIIDFLKGCVLGTSFIIPGVSGGTMAVVMNVFDPLMQAFSRTHFRASLPMLISLALGTLASTLALGNLITWLFAKALIPTTYFFAGVVTGSIPVIFRKVQRQAFRHSNLCFLLAGLALMLLTTFTDPIFPDISLASTHTAGHVLLFMGCGMVAAVTMIIPGISGSLVLTMLGAYRTIMEALSALDMWVLIPFTLGVAAGCILGVRFIRYVLNRYPVAAYAAILGLVIGSVPPILAKIQWALPDIWGITALAAGILLCWAFTRWDAKTSA